MRKLLMVVGGVISVAAVVVVAQPKIYPNDPQPDSPMGPG